MLEKAFALGDEQSAIDLKEVYGTTGEFDKLFKVSKKAAAMGHAMGQVNLAACYESGWGTQKNYQKALEYYEKAVQLGYGDPYGKVAEMRELAKALNQKQTDLPPSKRKRCRERALDDADGRQLRKRQSRFRAI